MWRPRSLPPAPCPTPKEHAFRIIAFGCADWRFRVQLPSDDNDAVSSGGVGVHVYVYQQGLFTYCPPPTYHPTQAMLTALTDGRWKISVDTKKKKKSDGYTLTAEYRGIYLPPALAPAFLDACTPTPPASAATVGAALGTALIMDTVLRVAIGTPLDAA